MHPLKLSGYSIEGDHQEWAVRHLVYVVLSNIRVGCMRGF